MNRGNSRSETRNFSDFRVSAVRFSPRFSLIAQIPNGGESSPTNERNRERANVLSLLTLLRGPSRNSPSRASRQLATRRSQARLVSPVSRHGGEILTIPLRTGIPLHDFRVSRAGQDQNGRGDERAVLDHPR